MIPAFRLDEDLGPPKPSRQLSPSELERSERLLSKMPIFEEHRRLERLLLERLKGHKTELQEMLLLMK
jgi:hypothetical protein